MEFDSELLDKLLEAGLPTLIVLWALVQSAIQWRKVGVKKIEAQSSKNVEVDSIKTKLTEAQTALTDAQTNSDMAKQVTELTQHNSNLAGAVERITQKFDGWQQQRDEWEKQRVETNNATTDALRQITAEFIAAMGQLGGKVEQSIVTNNTILGTIEQVQRDFSTAKQSVMDIETELRTRMTNLESTVNTQIGAIRSSVTELTAKLEMSNASTELHVNTLVQLSEILGQIAAVLDAIKDKTLSDEETQETEQTKQKEDKSNVQSTEQHNGLADPSGISGGTDQHDSGNVSQAVPPRATGTDTKREDDQSKSAIS